MTLTKFRVRVTPKPTVSVKIAPSPPHTVVAPPGVKIIYAVAPGGSGSLGSDESSFNRWDSEASYPADAVVEYRHNLWRSLEDNEGAEPGNYQPSWEMITTGLMTPVYPGEGEDTTSVIGSILNMALVLNDHEVYFRQYGDLSHSIRFGYSDHGVDGPIMAGWDRVGIATGNANEHDDKLVATFDQYEGARFYNPDSGELVSPSLQGHRHGYGDLDGNPSSLHVEGSGVIDGTLLVGPVGPTSEGPNLILDLGGAYATGTPGSSSNLKQMWFSNNGGSFYGMGISIDRKEEQIPANCTYSFYIGGIPAFEITSTEVQAVGLKFTQSSISASGDLDLISDDGLVRYNGFNLLTVNDIESLKSETATFMSQYGNSATATSATYATTAGSADTAGHATTADSATSAGSADNATYATSAGTASSADTAGYATSAGSAGTATTADSATYATTAGAATDVSKVPLTRTVNGHELSSDVSVTKSDLGLGNVDNTADVNKTVASAVVLTNSRTFQTNLGATGAVGFNGSADNLHGVTGTLPVGNGGSGRSSGTAYALIAGGTTSTGAHQSLASGATTDILVSGGAGALPVWTTATGSGAPVRSTSPTISGPAITGTAKVAQSGVIELYNTSDQTTNYEKTVFRYNSNVLEIGTLYGGTGVTRQLTIGSARTADGNAIQQYTQYSGSSPLISHRWGGTSLTGNMVEVGKSNDVFAASSSSQTMLAVVGGVSQSGTAAYNALLVNPTENSVGSGVNALIRGQVGGSDRFIVYTSGSAYIGGAIDLGNGSDTTISRVGPGIIGVEGNALLGADKNVSSGYLTKSPTYGSPIMVDTHPESAYSTIMPLLQNDLAYNLLRPGASYVVTKNGSGSTLSSPNEAFTPNAFFATVAPTATSDTFVIEVTVTSQLLLRWGTTIGIVMTDSWRAQDVTIEGYHAGSWNTVVAKTNQSRGYVWANYQGHGANEITKIRYTLTNFTTSAVSSGYCRILSLFAVNYNSTMLDASYLRRDGGSFYGTNAAPPALTVDSVDSNVDLLLSGKGSGVVKAGGAAVLTTTGAQPVSNKTMTSCTISSTRITPRVTTATSSATPTINTDNFEVLGLTAQAVDITSMTTNLSGTPTDYQPLSIYIVGTGSRAITWGTSFEAGPSALPTTTSGTQRLDVGFRWNAATSKWRCMASGSA